MPPVNIPWPTTASPGRLPGESQGTLINAYAVKIGDQIRHRRVAGLKPYLTINPPSPKHLPRSMLEVNDLLLHAWDGNLHIRHADGTNSTAIGGLAGQDRVTMARNMRPGDPNVVIVTKDLGAVIFDIEDFTIKPYPDAEISLAAATSVEYYSGYFFFTLSGGQFIASELQQTAVFLGSFAWSEYAADTLLRCKSVGSALAVMSDKSIEFWVDVGSVPFPLMRQVSIDVGLLSQWAVAGGTNEWENGLLWVAGDWTVRMLNGYTAQIVSTDDVVHDIREAAMAGSQLFAQVYVFNAQAIWSLTSDRWTWEYNLTTGAWHKRESYQRAHWRAAFACNFKGKWITQDWYNCRLSEVTPNAFDEEGERLRWCIESGPVKEFPASMRLPSIDIDMTVGIGREGRPSPFETEPVVMISWSHDGGANWGNPVARSMGKEGRYATKVTVNNLGRSTHQGVMIRLEVVDPVWVQLTSAVSTRTKLSRARQVNA